MPGARQHEPLPFFEETLVHSLGRHFFLGRSTRFLPERHAVLHGERRLQAARRLAGSRSAPARARRGRLLRLAGRLDEASAELDAALKLAPDLPEALAWRWELDDARGRARAQDLERAAALAPEDARLTLWLALSQADRGLLPRARESAAAAAALRPNDPFAAAVQAVLMARERRWEPAAAELDRALSLDGSWEWALRLRGICRHELGDARGCLADCLEAMRLDENSGLLFAMLGLHRDKSDPRVSVEAATRHLEAHPEDFWAYLFRADSRRSPVIGDHRGALEDLQRAAELEPGRGLVWAYLSRARLTQGDFKGSAQAIERAVALDPGCGWIRAWHGEFQRRSGDAAGALKSLDQAVALFPDYELAYAWRGSALRLLGKPARALVDLGKAIALKPHTLDLCLFERMQALRALGRVSQALEDIQRASVLNPKYAWETQPERLGAGVAELDAELKRRPRSVLAHLWRGELMMRLRDFARAEKDLTRALAGDGCPPQALILRGRARCELGRAREAFADFDAAVKRDPASPFAYAWRGRARLLAGRAAAAVADFSRALELEKNSAWILSWKGEAELALGRLEQAQASLSQAIQVHARFSEAFVLRGAARLAAGRAREALADLDAALAQRAADPRALYHRARALLALGRPAEARLDLARALEAPGPLSTAEAREGARLLRSLPPAPAAADGADAGGLEAAKAWQREGRHQEAADAYSKHLARRPDDEDALRRRSEAYRCLARYDLALRDRDAIVALHPGSADALAGRVELKRHLRDFAGGLADADAAVALDPGSAAAHVLRAECLRSLGRYHQARAAADRAVALRPEWSWAYVVRAKARRQAGDLRGALADTRAGEKAAGVPDPYVHAWRAEILRKLGRRQEALREAARASALAPGNAWVLALRGQLRVELGAADAGLADLLEAVRLDPRASCEHDFLGAEGPAVASDRALAWVYALRGGARRAADRLDEARADLDRAVKLAPRCFWIAAWRGELLARQGDAAAGIAELRRALKLHGRYAQARVWLGQALLSREEAPAARRQFEAALQLEPNNVWALIGRAVCLEKAGEADEAASLLSRARALAPGLFAQAGA